MKLVAMKWSEICIHTAQEAIEPISHILHESGASGVVIEDLSFYDRATLHSVEVKFFDPGLGTIDPEVVQLALLEHLKGKVLIADDDRA